MLKKMPGATAETEAALDKLDALLSLLAEGPPEEFFLVREHVQGARTYLLGAMNEEYILNLRLARNAADGITNASVQAKTLAILDDLTQPDAHTTKG